MVEGLGTIGEAGGGLYFYENDPSELGARNVIRVVDTTAAASVYVYTFGPVGSAVAAEDEDAPDPIEVPVVFGDPDYFDHEALALDRLPQQYRGDDDE